MKDELIEQIRRDAAIIAELSPAERRLVGLRWSAVKAELRRVADECAVARWSSQ